jgi:hypothetical protein
MIFVIEHEKDNIWQCETLYGVEDLDTSQYQPIKKIFLCENREEVAEVVKEIHRLRFEPHNKAKYGEENS